MSDRAILATSAIGEESAQSAVSWGAIIAGAAVGAALTITLVSLGAGLGLVSISPWSNSGVSATTLGVLAVAWLLAVQLFASGVGGYIAGRLRTTWVGVHTDEVFFRDTAHGFAVWAVATLVSATLLASALATVTSGAANVAGAAVQAGGQAASAAVGATGANANTDGQSPVAYFTDMLFRTQTPPAQGDVGNARAEVGRILARSAINGDLSADDKAYVSQVVARETGLSPQDAEKRVNDVLAKAKATADEVAAKAKQAAETARKVGIYTSLWVFVSLLVGAFSATYFATVGGRLRDDLPAS
ncbi:hypothetical protein G3545_06140 [Starkeya sp. ORNL1]|uniref:hypothetical protein n=1 Tax=Starkeya sp. ORNL1 TaxID=2709380 RepID=UPI00146469E0|nr:hypothetical protein [Starkeya sp. ORNL1]QJP13265.1 hypothetical protein G3545_06140 [Starkeya sp. ORNL1]